MAWTQATSASWPPLRLETWRDTYETLHIWTQVVGKICLALTPRTNHFWNIAFQITPRGLATPAMMAQTRAITMTFDFVAHQLVIQCSDGDTETVRLEPQTVAEFYKRVMQTLHQMGIDVHIWTMPVEIQNPIRFEADTAHKSYDRASANAFWRALIAIKPVFDSFRAGFIGKSSPLHFFWGSFDLALTRFSGRRAPERPGADVMTRESYSHEVISHGFWPGNEMIPEPVFYTYAAPEPVDFKHAAVRPAAASYNSTFSEFLLPYEAVRTSATPSEDLKAFLESTYNAAADLAGWNRAELERA